MLYALSRNKSPPINLMGFSLFLYFSSIMASSKYFSQVIGQELIMRGAVSTGDVPFIR